MEVNNIKLIYGVSQQHVFAVLLTATTGTGLKAIIREKLKITVHTLILNNTAINDNETLASKNISDEDIIIAPANTPGG